MIIKLIMLKQDYYCLISGLKDLLLEGVKPNISSAEFKDELSTKLHSTDLELVKLIYLQYDNQNLLNYLLDKNKAHSPLGTYSKEYLMDQIKNPETIIDYMIVFINHWRSEEQSKSNLYYENYLQSLYYQYVLKVDNDFLKQWFAFDRNVKNIITAINCRKYNYDIENQLIAIQNDNEIYQILQNKTINPELIKDLVPYGDEIIQLMESDKDISNKEKSIDFIKWKFLDDLTVFNYFTIEKILSYIIKLEMTERWYYMNTEEGKEVYKKLIDNMAESYKFPEEYAIRS